MTKFAIDSIKFALVISPFFGIAYCLGGFARLGLLAAIGG